MSKFKKMLSMVLVVAMTAVIAISGTVAYLQDDDSDVNVMTLGNVKIEQLEYERVMAADGTYEMITTESGTGYKLQPFTQAKPLYPTTDTAPALSQNRYYLDQLGEGFTGSLRTYNESVTNILDKIVLVENTGKTDAYVRTLIAYEAGRDTDGLVMSTSSKWTCTNIGEVVIDGYTYNIDEYVYNGKDVHDGGILPAGEATAAPCLSQIYAKYWVDNEWCEAIDGNKNGTWDVLVLSQAVQAAGFDDAATALDIAFGKSSEKAAEWFGGTAIPTVVSSAEALSLAIAEGGNVLLTEDVDMGTATVTITGDTTIDLAGNTLSADRGAADVTDKASYAVLYVDGADVVLTGDGDVVNSAEDGAYCVYVDNGATVTITGGNYITYHDAVYVRDGKLIITGGFFQAKGDTKATADYIHPDYPDEPASFTAEVINCSKDAYINFKEGTSYSNGITAEVVITGGTFVNEDPSNIFEGWYTNQSYVPEGYKVIAEEQSNGDIWYTVVAE